MPKKKKIIDEHENMEPVVVCRSNNFLMVIFILIAVCIVSYITVNAIQNEREKQKIDEIVSSIQNEIYLKQCNLDKMYCCGYKDQKACDNWVEAGCTESDGSLEINCSSILEEEITNEKP